jgi:hypothetical protein
MERISLIGVGSDDGNLVSFNFHKRQGIFLAHRKSINEILLKMISKFFFALKVYYSVSNALQLYLFMRYYDTVDKSGNTHNFFIQTTKSEYGIKVFRC